ncbi:MAG: phosphomethylpyrimidine synthase ThiC, partial [Candidatus Omnitrophica bacterium]|nr:phosphomethylpyrimidine synthase ThiC [Candidatus Omnitrophota bacterium]
MLSQELIQQVAKNEKVKPQFLKQQLNQGRAVILFNRNHPNCQPMAVGEGLKVKINTNLGLSTKKTDIKAELKKLRVALASGTDTIMDLSVSPNLGA